MRTPATLIALLAPLLSAVVCFADPKPTGGLADTLLALDQQWWEASGKYDIETLSRIAANDFVGIGWDQQRWTKAGLLDHLRHVRTADLKYIGDREVIRLDEHAAVMTYEAQFKVYEGDQLLDTTRQRCSACWVQRDGGWFVKFSQATLISDAPVRPETTTGEGPPRATSPGAKHSLIMPFNTVWPSPTAASKFIRLGKR